MSNAEELISLIGPGFTIEPTASHAPAGSYYTDPDLYALEVERVFGNQWLFFCHQSQTPNAGDYLAGEIAGIGVYVVRDSDGQMRGFYNVCQHRGHELVTGQGTVANALVCPYHSWSYDLTGSLKGAPRMRQVPDFCKADVALSPVRLVVVAGFVFLNLDENAASFSEMCPEFEPILRSMVAESNELQLVAQHDFDIQANWKIVTENFLEAYHVDFSGPAHQALGNIIDIDTYRFNIAGKTIEYMADGGAAHALPYRSNEVGGFTNSRGAPFHQVFLYPNMTFSVFPGTNLLFVYNMRPNGAQQCAEQIMWFALDPEVSDASVEAERYVSVQLNREDIALVEAVQRGVRSPGYEPGRYMVDSAQEAAWGEQFVHHFNQLHIAALRRPSPSAC